MPLISSSIGFKLYKSCSGTRNLTYPIIFYLTKMANNCGLVSVLGILLSFTLVHNMGIVSGQNIPSVALFAFGDSNFDAGNRKYLTSATLAQNFWPYGKSRDDPNGKFSDGKIAPDFIGKLIILYVSVYCCCVNFFFKNKYHFKNLIQTFFNNIL